MAADIEPGDVAAAGVLREDATVVTMLSGGRDSVCLVDLAVRVSGAARVHALHVDYGLRPEAGADAAFCAELCERLGVSLTVVRAGAAPARGNVQEWARDRRYAAARDLARARGVELVVSGHTASDQAETVLYRLAASPSRRALLGMRRLAPLPGGDDGLTLGRPLLSYTREETGAYCSGRGLAWRDDSTNGSARYARNRLRAGLVPALAAIHPAAERNVARTAELLRDEAAVLDELVESAVNGERIALDELAALSPALRRLVVQRLADAAAGGRPVAGAGRRADEVAALGRHGTAELHVGGGVRAVSERGVLSFAPLRPAERP